MKDLELSINIIRLLSNVV